MRSWVNTPRGLAGLAVLVCVSSIVDLNRTTDAWSIVELAISLTVIAAVAISAHIQRGRTKTEDDPT
jgi:hypothetical protein